MNNNWFCENIRATNPCGETAVTAVWFLPIGLHQSHQIRHRAFTERARFDWDEYRKVVAVFTRMLDNVVEINGLPLQGQRDESCASVVTAWVSWVWARRSRCCA